MLAPEHDLAREQGDDRRQHGGQARDAADRRHLDQRQHHQGRAITAPAERLHHVADFDVALISQLAKLIQHVAYAMGSFRHRSPNETVIGRFLSHPRQPRHDAVAPRA
jgi:hypothetical protein